MSQRVTVLEITTKRMSYLLGRYTCFRYSVLATNAGVQ